MLEKLTEFFEGEKSLDEAVGQGKELTERDLQIATAVLLVEMASADRKISPKEGEAVVSVMSRVFELPPNAVPELVKAAIASRKEQGRVDEFLRCLNERFDREKKVRVMAMLWKVMMADGTIGKDEQQLMRRVKEVFGADDKETDEALRMAQHGEV